MARQFEKMTVELSAADRKLLQDIKKQITLLNRPNRTEHTLTDGPQRLTEPDTDSAAPAAEVEQLAPQMQLSKTPKPAIKPRSGPIEKIPGGDF